MDDEIKMKRLDPVIPEPGLTLYRWGAVSTYTMTKAEYDEMFGSVIPTNKSDDSHG